MTTKNPDGSTIIDGIKVDAVPKQEDRLDKNMFFKSMFQTFGYTLIVFMALLVLVFIVKWIF